MLSCFFGGTLGLQGREKQDLSSETKKAETVSAFSICAYKTLIPIFDKIADKNKYQKARQSHSLFGNVNADLLAVSPETLKLYRSVRYRK